MHRLEGSWMCATHAGERGRIIARVVWRDALSQQWVQRRRIRSGADGGLRRGAARQYACSNRHGNSAQQVPPRDVAVHPKNPINVIVWHSSSVLAQRQTQAGAVLRSLLLEFL